jgi:hypothetical protein
MRATWAAMVALALLVAPWAYAGNLSVMSDAQDTRQRVRSFIPPGAIVKAEFKSNHDSDPDMVAESDSLLPDPDMADAPAVRERTARPPQKESSAMAPPPSIKPAAERRDSSPQRMTASADEYEDELAKDLVLPPPPPKIEDDPGRDLQTLTESTGKPMKPAQRKKMGPARAPSTDRDIYQASRAQVRKVRPVTRNNWATPAGSHQRPVRHFANNPPRVGHGQVSQPAPGPDDSERFVRNGVTIKLAPRTAPAGYSPNEYGPSASEEIVSAASEIIGLPFAFISSLF